MFEVHTPLAQLFPNEQACPLAPLILQLPAPLHASAPVQTGLSSVKVCATLVQVPTLPACEQVLQAVLHWELQQNPSTHWLVVH